MRWPQQKKLMYYIPSLRIPWTSLLASKFVATWLPTCMLSWEAVVFRSTLMYRVCVIPMQAFYTVTFVICYLATKGTTFELELAKP